MVVLDELLRRGNARLGMPLAAVGLGEEATLVGKDGRREDHEAGKAGGDRLHETGATSRSGCGSTQDPSVKSIFSPLESLYSSPLEPWQVLPEGPQQLVSWDERVVIREQQVVLGCDHRWSATPKCKAITLQTISLLLYQRD